MRALTRCANAAFLRSSNARVPSPLAPPPSSCIPRAPSLLAAPTRQQQRQRRRCVWGEECVWGGVCVGRSVCGEECVGRCVWERGVCDGGVCGRRGCVMEVFVGDLCVGRCPFNHLLFPPISPSLSSPLHLHRTAPDCTLSTSALFVDPKGALSACCGSQDSPCGSLEAALARASDNATITLASGTYTRTAPPPSAPILLPPLLALTILGPGLPSPPAVLDCNGGPCLVASCQSTPTAAATAAAAGAAPKTWCGQQQPVLVVEYLSVVNGVSGWKQGEVVWVAAQQPQLKVEHLSGVTTGSGGRLLPDGYRAVLSHVSFSNCTSTGPSGGAVAVLEAATATTLVATAVTISSSRVRGGGVGGGLYVGAGARVSLKGAMFEGCYTEREEGVAGGYGGCIASFSAANLTVEDSSFTGCKVRGGVQGEGWVKGGKRGEEGGKTSQCSPQEEQSSSTLPAHAHPGLPLPPLLLWTLTSSPPSFNSLFPLLPLLPLLPPLRPLLPPPQAMAGGAINEFNSSTTIANTTFTACTADQGADVSVFPSGGAILFNTSLHMHVRDSSFRRCASTLTGGAISVQSAVAPLTVTGSVFEENQAFMQGGCLELIMLPGVTEILDCRFINNVVTNVPSFAAAVVSYGAALTVRACLFQSNAASPTPAGDGSASATYLSQGAALMVFAFMDPLFPITIADSTFKNNTVGVWMPNPYLPALCFLLTPICPHYVSY
ncbi:unnamed protein product [Closterium sp. NIES-65]|nr:unnamed protein product [Closterium sp. NIES-65]